MTFSTGRWNGPDERCRTGCNHADVEVYFTLKDAALRGVKCSFNFGKTNLYSRYAAEQGMLFCNKKKARVSNYLSKNLPSSASRWDTPEQTHVVHAFDTYYERHQDSVAVNSSRKKLFYRSLSSDKIFKIVDQLVEIDTEYSIGVVSQVLDRTVEAKDWKLCDNIVKKLSTEKYVPALARLLYRDGVPVKTYAAALDAYKKFVKWLPEDERDPHVLLIDHATKTLRKMKK
jgi:hypothetical protein